MIGRRHPARNGFSLLELSVVIVVVALIVSFGLSLGGNAIKAAERVTTQERMAAIKDALEAHFKYYGYLPCPYDRRLTPKDTGFGVESRPAQGDPCDTSPGLVLAAPATGNVLIGGLPVRALGLPDSYAADAWGNKFTYGVSEGLTLSAVNYTTTKPALQINSGDRTGTNYMVTTALPIPDPTVTHPATPGGGAAYIVISHGPDGRGAYPLTLDSIPVACGAGAQNDVGNCNDSGEFYDTAYNDGTNDSLFFDDYVVWGSNASQINSASPSAGCGGTVSGKCENWCAPCSVNVPAAPGSFVGTPHLCSKVITSNCTATCIWSGKLPNLGSNARVARCP